MEGSDPVRGGCLSLEVKEMRVDNLDIPYSLRDP